MRPELFAAIYFGSFLILIAIYEVLIRRSLIRRFGRTPKEVNVEAPSDLRVTGLRTDLYQAGTPLLDFVAKEVEAHFQGKVPEDLVIAITSKIVSLAEGRVVPRKQNAPEAIVAQKRALIVEESDRFLGETLFGVALTIKHGVLVPSAGIDESNSERGDFILFPKNPYASAELLGKTLRSLWGLKRLGVIITDSHTQPLRKGVTGFGLSHWGFKATKNYVGHEDLFGRAVKMTHVNVLDALSVAAVYTMGETDEQRPIALLEGTGAEFTDETSPAEIRIPPEEDLYGHLLFPRSK